MTADPRPDLAEIDAVQRLTEAIQDCETDMMVVFGDAEVTGERPDLADAEIQVIADDVRAIIATNDTLRAMLAAERERADDLAGDAATLRGFIKTHGMTPSMMHSRARIATAQRNAAQAEIATLKRERDEARAENERLRPKPRVKPQPAHECEKCGGYGWVWGHELNEAPDRDPSYGPDDSRYSCDGEGCRLARYLAPRAEGEAADGE